MCATSTSSSVSRPDERRRSVRLRATSLIYAQLGSDNGGVVVNLGLEGMSCQAAHKLITGQNSTITLKLRGSGLNAEIAGQVVWLGATQKAVGISFKSLPTTVKQSIADWITRESGPTESDQPKEGSPQKSISEIAEMAVPEKTTIPRSLSAALALSRATSADHVSPAPENPGISDRPGPADSSAVILPVEPNFEIFTTNEYSRAAADPSSGDSTDTVLDRTVVGHGRPDNVVGFPENGHSSDVHQVLGLPPLSVLKQEFAQAMQEIVPASKELEAGSDAALQFKAEIPKNSELQKVTAPAAVPVTPPPSPNFRRPSAPQIAEKCIPPPILVAWNRLNVKQKQLLTHAGSVCLGLVIGLVAILALTHIHIPGTSEHPVQTAPQQYVATPTAPPADASDTLRDFPKQAPPTPSTIPSTNQSKPPEPSAFSKLADSIFGTGSDGSSKINDYQMGLAVWTSQRSGYYYCSDDPYARSVQSGVPMLQGDALQAGYRPRLGQFCN